ncbi:MAG: CPBP family intramembrane metalloprotease [Treponema sp.]|nr:CPBP family intramembrane metalloprotease [Treponema sp.]
MLFFPGYYSFIPELSGQVIPFSALRELNRVFSYSLPALALLWYLVLEKKSLAVNSANLKPEKKDLFSFLWAFPGLALIAAGINFIGAGFSSFTAPIVEAPVDALGWIAVGLSCVGTGYLEESFFRFYLLQKLESRVPQKTARILFSVLLFAVCHVYEGPLGIMNAALAGFLLSIIFTQYRTLHGIAWAHALYNSLVYIFSFLSG